MDGGRGAVISEVTRHHSRQLRRGASSRHRPLAADQEDQQPFSSTAVSRFLGRRNVSETFPYIAGP